MKDKKFQTRERWIFNQRVKELSKEELENRLYMREELCSILTFIVCVFAAIIILSGITYYQSQNEFNSRTSDMNLFAAGLCKVTYNQGLTSITKFENALKIDCETESLTVRDLNKKQTIAEVIK